MFIRRSFFYRKIYKITVSRESFIFVSNRQSYTTLRYPTVHQLSKHLVQNITSTFPASGQLRDETAKAGDPSQRNRRRVLRRRPERQWAGVRQEAVQANAGAGQDVPLVPLWPLQVAAAV